MKFICPLKNWQKYYYMKEETRDFLIPIESFFEGREEKIYHVQFYLFL